MAYKVLTTSDLFINVSNLTNSSSLKWKTSNNRPRELHAVAHQGDQIFLDFMQFVANI